MFPRLRRDLAAFLILLTAVPAVAAATPVTATLTADNHYALYVGNAAGSSLTFIGRNELGAEGNPGEYNWSLPETFSFDIGFENVLYIVAWSDNSIAQGLIGEFTANGQTLVTDSVHWEVALSTVDLGDGSAAPTTSELALFNQTAAWNAVQDTLPYGSAPWGAIAGLSPSAQWIWGGGLVGPVNSGEFQVFRAPVPGVGIAEPSTFALLCVSLAGLIAWRQSRPARS